MDDHGVRTGGGEPAGVPDREGAAHRAEMGLQRPGT
jgi:hypothetical protein